MENLTKAGSGKASKSPKSKSRSATVFRQLKKNKLAMGVW
jgi:hypothetical protein